MPPWLTLYRLARDPYLIDQLESFDPAAGPPGWACVPVDGFRQLGTTLAPFLAHQARTKQPAHVLIRGPSGMGRTAAAREVLRRYLEARRTNPAGPPVDLLVPKARLNADRRKVFNTWVVDLQAKLRAWNGGAIVPALEPLFDRLFEVENYDFAFENKFRNLLTEIDKKHGVGPKQAAFAFCLEDPPEPLRAADVLPELFNGVNAAVVLVTREGPAAPGPDIDPVVWGYRELVRDGKGWIFPRDPLTPTDAYDLAAHYWDKERPGVPCPFSQVAINSLADVLDEYQLVVIDVLAILRVALISTAHTLLPAGPGVSWPADPRLAVSGATLLTAARGYTFRAVTDARWRNRAPQLVGV